MPTATELRHIDSENVGQNGKNRIWRKRFGYMPERYIFRSGMGFDSFLAELVHPGPETVAADAAR